MIKQLLKIGNSVAITIPAEEVVKLKLKPGDKVEIYSDGESLKIVPIRKIKPIKLRGLWKGLDISEEDIAEVRRAMPAAKVAITLEEKLLDEVDDLVGKGILANRSQAIAEAVREKINRLERRRLAAEAAKLDPEEEKDLADESLSGESHWPEY